MQTACKVLDVDFISVRSKINVTHKIVFNNIRSRLHDGLYGISKFLCSACTYGYRSVVYRAAAKYRVPLIFWGETHGEATQSMEERAMHGLGLSISMRLSDVNTYKSRFYRMLQRLEFPVAGNSPFSLKPLSFNDSFTKPLRLFDYIEWDRRKLKQTITEKVGWKKPSGYVSTWRTDCLLHPFVNYCYIKMFSCSKDCFGYCNMINSNQMSREQAMMQEEETLRIDEGFIQELLEKEIGLSSRSTKAIMAL